MKFVASWLDARHREFPTILGFQWKQPIELPKTGNNIASIVSEQSFRSFSDFVCILNLETTLASGWFAVTQKR